MYDVTKGFSQEDVAKVMFGFVEDATNISRGIDFTAFQKVMAYVDCFNALSPTATMFFGTPLVEVTIHPMIKDLIFPKSVRLKEGDLDWEDFLVRPEVKAAKRILGDNPSYGEFSKLMNRLAKSFRGKYDRVSLTEVRKNVSLVNVLDRTSCEGYVGSPANGVFYMPIPVSEDFSSEKVYYCYDAWRLFERFWDDLVNAQNESK